MPVNVPFYENKRVMNSNGLLTVDSKAIPLEHRQPPTVASMSLFDELVVENIHNHKKGNSRHCTASLDFGVG